MRCGLPNRRWVRSLFAGAGLTLLAAPAAPAQTVYNPPYCPPAPCLPPGYAPGVMPLTPAPGMTPPSTATPPTTPTTPPTQETAAPEAASPFAFAPESSALALSGGTAAVAAPGDAAYDNNRPDRAEFFYGKCGCFKLAGLDPRAPGPPKPETSVDYQELRPYLEFAAGNRASIFIEGPVRWVNPEQNANEVGFSNLMFGTKIALLAQPDQYLTFVFNTTTPTADVDRGLGNQLWTLEPGILWMRQLTDRIVWHNELRDWIPLGGTDFAGNILRYGTAVSYLFINRPNFRVYSISELVGWSVLGGKEAAFYSPPVFSASGDTIINAKGGVRFGFGPLVGPGNLSRSDLYVGYGRPLTGEVWYKDLFRVEYSLRF
jgi:hypothetical protein